MQLGVLISGRGSNLEATLTAIDDSPAGAPILAEPRRLHLLALETRARGQLRAMGRQVCGGVR